MILALMLPMALAATEPPHEQPERPAGDPARMICKRFVETGSLVKSYRECKTRWEWQRERENRRTMSVADSCGARGDELGKCL